MKGGELGGGGATKRAVVDSRLGTVGNGGVTAVVGGEVL